MNYRRETISGLAIMIILAPCLLSAQESTPPKTSTEQWVESPKTRAAYSVEWNAQRPDQEPRASYRWSVEPAPYLIGVHCEPASSVQFKSEEVGGLITVEGGLKINRISKNSPAEKVGMRIDDVILFLDDQMVSSIEELTEIVRKHGAKEISGALIRDQEIVSFEVTPAKRKTDYTEDRFVPAPSNLSWYRPNAASLPKGYSVTIQLEQGSPPKISLEKDEQTWVVKSENVAKLPKEVAPFATNVYRSLNPLVAKVTNQFSYRELAANNWNQKDFFKSYPKWVYSQQVHSASIDSKLEKLQQQIEELANAVSELKNDR